MYSAMGACREFEGDLAASLYGDLGAAEQAALDRHLAGCAPCRRERTELARTVELLRPVPLKLTPRERARVSRKPLPRIWMAVGAAAAAVLVAFLLRPAPVPAPRPAPV